MRLAFWRDSKAKAVIERAVSKSRPKPAPKVEAKVEPKKKLFEFRVAKDGTMHSGIGKVSFKTDDLLANLKAYFQAVQAAKPDDAKGTYIKTLSLASTMGPGIKVDLRSLR